MWLCFFFQNQKENNKNNMNNTKSATLKNCWEMQKQWEKTNKKGGLGGDPPTHKIRQKIIKIDCWFCCCSVVGFVGVVVVAEMWLLLVFWLCFLVLVVVDIVHVMFAFFYLYFCTFYNVCVVYCYWPFLFGCCCCWCSSSCCGCSVTCCCVAHLHFDSCYIAVGFGRTSRIIVRTKRRKQ